MTRYIPLTLKRWPYDNKTFLYWSVSTTTTSLLAKEWRKSQTRSRVCELVREMRMGRRYGEEYKKFWEENMWLVIPRIFAHAPPNYINSIKLGKLRHVEMSTL
ncbi:LOW QUALITY PROTEIN: hypothetical protein OSB04_004431 [Centaurea solstitialis]|uniref:Uncharacterized protein n=1 Tax=Centaurea solstitialis TaxID=347529 RepID=A0AA38U8F1_9ASTR|nr:LOW QUALITY PROTEIN: hypothetical protein OSB04_004431 [Centaurea solstitialis]